MNRRIIFTIFTIFLLFPSLVHAYSVDETFTKLIRNEASVTYGEAEFEVCNNFGTDIVAYDNTFNFDLKYEKTPSYNQKTFIEQDVEIPVKVPIYKEICKQRSSVNGTFDFCYPEQTGFTWDNYTEKQWLPATSKMLLNNECYNVLIRSEWAAVLGDNSREWVPYIMIGETKFEQKKWAWWNTSWTNKKQVNVSVTGAGTTEDAYPVLLWVDDEASMQADYDDLRFLNETETGELDFWLQEYNSTHAKVWMESDQNITNATISYYMYYGNDGATTTSDISTTGLFGDDFNRANGPVGNDWADVFGSGSTAIASNWMTITNDNDDFEIISHDIPDRTGVVMQFTEKYDDVSDADGWRWGGSLESWSFGRDHALMGRADDVDYYGDGGYTQLCAACTANNVAYLYEIRTELTKINVSINDTDYNNEYARAGTSTAANFSAIMLSSKGGVASYDNVFIRPFHDPEPAAVFGTEESGSSQPPLWSLNDSSTPANYSDSTLSTFNITWVNGSALAAVNSTNVTLLGNWSGSEQEYTMTLISGDVWNGTYGYEVILGTGQYQWRYRAYNNASTPLPNTSGYWNASIAQAAQTCANTFGAASPITYPADVTDTCACSALGTATLYRNGTNVTVAENATAVDLGADLYQYICNTTGNTNYSTASDTDNYVIDPADNPLTFTINGDVDQNYTLSYGSFLNVTVSEPCPEGCIMELYKNTSLLVNYSDSEPPNNTMYYHNASEDNSQAIFFTANISAANHTNDNYTQNTSQVTFWVFVEAALTVDVLDEQTETGITFNITLQNTTFASTSYDLSLFSANSTNMPYGDVTIIVWAEDYSQRVYYLTGLTNSSTESIVAYLIHDDDGQQVTFTVQNMLQQVLPNASIDIYRVLSGGLTLVAQGVTDDAGQFPFPLNPTASYNINIERTGYAVKNTTLIPSSTSYTFWLLDLVDNLPSYWDYFKEITSSCDYTNASRLLNCSWADSSEQVTAVWLTVMEENFTYNNLLCNNTTSNTTGWLGCALPYINNQNMSYAWSLYAELDENLYVLESGSWLDITQYDFGTTGLIVSLLILLTVSFFGIQMESPVATIVFTMFGVGISYLLGFLTISSSFVTIFVGFVVSGVILIYKMR